MLKRQAAPLVVALAAVVTAGITARLGVWQLDRAAQKRALQAAMEERRALPPLPQAELGRDAAALAGQVHRTTELQGRWSPQSTVFLDNRQMGGRPGFFVVTALILQDGTAVAVQRGWLHRDVADRTQVRAPALPAGEVTVGGRIAPPPSRLHEFDAAAEGAIRQNLDLASWGRETGLDLRPMSLLQAASGDKDGLARDWPAPATDVHKHYGYAFQWFSLSALTLTLYVWFQFLRPLWRARRPA